MLGMREREIMKIIDFIKKHMNKNKLQLDMYADLLNIHLRSIVADGSLYLCETDKRHIWYLRKSGWVEKNIGGNNWLVKYMTGAFPNQRDAKEIFWRFPIELSESGRQC